MTRVAVVFPFQPEQISAFTDLPGCEVVWNNLENAEVILGQPTPEQIQSCPTLKWVQVTSAGVDGYARNRALFDGKITLTNISGAFGQSISECILAMVLSLYKHLNLFRDNQRAHLWKDEGRQDSPRGKNLLILGTGNIGSAVARIFSPFDCKITGIRRTAGEKPEGFDEVYTLDHLDELLPKADIVVGVLPGTPETTRLFDARRLSLLKPSAILANCGRGSLIDCEALAKALREGQLYGAALDVTDPEPLPPDHPLWDCPNAVITPHATGGSFGHLLATEEKVIEICHRNLERYLRHEPLLNVVDFDTGYRRLENRA